MLRGGVAMLVLFPEKGQRQCKANSLRSAEVNERRLKAA